VLWGQAVGDALGTTVEFRDEFAIATRDPSEWPRELIGLGPFMLLPGQVTDDTELALALARSIARQGGYDDEDAAAAYVRWRRSEPFDCGMATHQAFGGAATPTASVLRARASVKTQANGSLMRSSPLGVLGAGMPRASLAKLAETDSTLSHPHPVCQAACAVFVTTIADAIETGASGPTLFARALEFAKGSLVEDTLLAAQKELPISDGDNMGWVRLALQHAFFHLLHTTDFEAGLIQTVVKGGDTDTNAAIVGALLGATLGELAIPKRWRDTVRDCLPQRPPEYRCADLSELADTLASLLPGP
jgi:ADP-ribosyl-[dinitrogen reductase] hydrolase